MCCLRATAALLLVAICSAGAAAQRTGQGNPPLVIPSVTGRELFDFYCAPCHGRDARGHGPVAAALKMPPADLTALSRRNGGAFPAARIEAFVANGSDESPVHGTGDMPVWGPIFKGLDPSDTLTKTRIANVVAYVNSLQVP